MFANLRDIREDFLRSTREDFLRSESMKLAWGPTLLEISRCCDMLDAFPGPCVKWRRRTDCDSEMRVMMSRLRVMMSRLRQAMSLVRLLRPCSATVRKRVKSSMERKLSFIS